jgi:hypothetical protein
LQFLQIFFTEGLTFMIDLSTAIRAKREPYSNSGAACRQTKNISRAAPGTAVAEQIGLFQQARIVVRHQVRLQLRHEVHHYDDHDQQ